MASRFKQEPTEFQLQVLELSLQSFRERTNICQIVREEAFRLKQLRLSDEDVDTHTAYYHRKLKHVHKWHVCGLKDLKFLPKPLQDAQTPQLTQNERKAESAHEPTPSTSRLAVTTRRAKEIKILEKTKESTEPKLKASKLQSDAKTGVGQSRGKSSKTENGETEDAHKPTPSTSKMAVTTRKTKELKIVESTKESTEPKPKASKSHSDAKTKVGQSKGKSDKTVPDNNEAFSYSAETLVNEVVNEPISIEKDTKPTEFQSEILEMDIDRFIDETNIRQIASNELQRKNEVVTNEMINVLIGLFFNRRMEVENWWSCGLKHLKYRLCECKRGPQIQTRNVKIQKDIKTRESFTQCEHHDDPMLSISTQTVDFTEVRMSQLTQRHETQGTQRNRVSDPLEASLLKRSSENIPSPEAITLNDTRPEPIELTPAYVNSLPLYAPMVIEVDDSDSENDDQADVNTGNFEVLLETTTQTQNFNENTEQIVTESEHPFFERNDSAPASDDVIVKDEPMTISQINAKYEGELVAEEIVQHIVVLNETPNTQQMFKEIMEEAGSGSIDDSIVVDLEQRPSAAALGNNVNDLCDPKQNSPVQSTQGSSIITNELVIAVNNGKPVEENRQMRPQKPCPKSKKRFYAQEESVELQLNRPECTTVPVQDVEGAMAELFAGTETPEMILQQTENNENVDPQLTPKTAMAMPMAANNNNIGKVTEVANQLRRTIKASRLQKTLAMNADDTLSTIQPPKYNYNALQLVPKKRIQQYACQINTVALPQDEEPNIEFDDTPPCIENPREFLIEDSSIDGGSQISQTVSNRMPTAASILNTDNSLFLSSQLLNEQHQGTGSEQFFTAPDTIETQCDNLPDVDIMADGEVISTEIDSIAIEPPEKRRKIDANVRDSNVQAAAFVSSSSTVQTVVLETENHENGIPMSSHTNQQVPVAVVAATPAAHSTGFEWISRVPTSSYHTYLHYIDIENVSYRYEVDRLPSDVAYNICQQQEGLRTTINFKCDGLHRIEIKGECMRKLLKLKYTEWRAVQAVLEMVKHFTYNSRAKEPKASSLLERSLHYLFASASKFSNVHIQRIQYDEEQNRDVCRVLQTTYSLKPKPKRLQSTIDPYILENMHYGPKRMRKK